MKQNRVLLEICQEYEVTLKHLTSHSTDRAIYKSIDSAFKTPFELFLSSLLTVISQIQVTILSCSNY